MQSDSVRTKVLFDSNPWEHSLSSFWADKAHEARISFLQPVPYIAMFLATSHDSIPISFLSCSSVLRHVVLDPPRLRFPSGCHARAVLQLLILFIHSTWPIHFHRLVLTSALTRLVSVLFIRSSLEQHRAGHRIFYSPHARIFKCIKLSCISFVHFACFTTVKKYWFHQSKIIAMSEFVIWQEIRPDLHTTLTWIFCEKNILSWSL